METDDKHTASNSDIADLQQRIVHLEEALADYAHRYGLTDKARAALTVSSTISPGRLPK